VARFLGGAVERDESGDTGGVDTLDRGEIEREGLPAHERRYTVQQAPIMAADKLSQIERLNCRDGASYWLVAHCIGHQKTS
jgi:hypothetical protein